MSKIRFLPGAGMVLAMLLYGNVTIAALAGIMPSAGEPKGQRSDFKNAYANTKFTYSKSCDNAPYRQLCHKYMEDYAGRFEREVIKALNESNPDELELERLVQSSMQEGDMRLFTDQGRHMATLRTVLEQKILGRPQTYVLEAVNFDLDTGEQIDFGALFKKRELAAMRCARAIEARYAATGGVVAQVIIAVAEYEPRNFRITEDGLRFYLPGEMEPGSGKRIVYMDVPLERLMQAGPVQRFWPERIPDP